MRILKPRTRRFLLRKVREVVTGQSSESQLYDIDALDIRRETRLEIRGLRVRVLRGQAKIHYKVYQQDGTMQEMTCEDTVSNRGFVSWVQAHDRYTRPGE